MSAVTSPVLDSSLGWKLPYRGKVGMACLIIAESAIFSIFVVAYLFYLGKSVSGPTPREVLDESGREGPSVNCELVDSLFHMHVQRRVVLPALHLLSFSPAG